MKFCKALTFLLVMAACPEIMIFGQVSRAMQDFDFIKDSNPWLTSVNVAGIGQLQTSRTSMAGLSFSKDNGGLVGIEGSDDSFLAEITTESYMKFSDRIAFYGKLSYLNFTGKNMGGPILMDPSYNPINFLESTEETTGNKNKELYSLSGGMAYTFNPRWSIGARIDYEAGNTAKRKDPRFKSIWMDIDFSLGARFAPSDAFAAGLSIEYRKTVEDLSGDIFGTTDQQYFILVDYGGFFGSLEYFDGDKGYVPASSSARPMYNAFYGGSIQIEAGRKIKVFNEITYLHRSGYYGKKASASVTFCEFEGNIIRYGGTLNIPAGSNLHQIRLNAGYEGIKNNENIYRFNTASGENTIVEYFGSKEVLDRTDAMGSLSYTCWRRTDNLRPDWEYGVMADADYMALTSTVYPYYRRQDITSIRVLLHGKKNFIVKSNIFTAGASADFFTGGGTAKEDGTLASSTSNPPKSGDGYLNRDFEYKTLSRICGMLNFRYTRLIKDKAAAYIDVRNSYTRSLKKAEYLKDSYRNTFVISVGCTF